MRLRKKMRGCLMTAAAVSALLVNMPDASAQDHRKVQLNIEAQDLGGALSAVSRQSGVEIAFDAEAVAGKRARALRGTFTADAAVRALIDGTGLIADFREDGILIRGRSQTPSEIADRPVDTSEAIIVTGSKIAGAKSASPMVILSAEDIRRTGFDTVGDVMRSVPQNFGGGQNPGLSFTIPQASGENVGSGSSFNLRGLGADSTLALLNGSRLVYGGYRQSIDVDAIPIQAISRIEIVTDGASAIYGSDAVAGVANILLQPDFDGLLTSVRLGGATEGGADQVTASMLAGRRWKTGGFLAAYSYARDGGIDASQRDYTRSSNPGLTLFPDLRRHNALISAHQQMTDGLRFSMDAVYSWRRDRRGFAATVAANSPRYIVGGPSWMFAVAPKLDWEISPDWSASLTGSYGVDHTRLGTDTSTGGAYVPTLRACYCNRALAGELAVNGTLVALPGGDAKVAVGAGGRENYLHAYRTVGPALDIDVSQRALYAFGELNLPIVGPAQGIPFLHRLTATAAIRYESYRGVEDLATPKIGIVLEPLDGIALKSSWSRSFKAPTLFQRYNTQSATVRLASLRGGTAYPATATVVELGGGRPELDAEKARTWTASIELQPRFAPGLRIETSYFSIRFENRITSPIVVAAQSLSNPVYAGLITRNPTPTQLDQATAGHVLQFSSVGTFVPANVVAIIDNQVRNVAAQKVQGVDLTVSFRRETARAGTFSATATGSYLESEQQVVEGLPYTSLAGAFYNPAQFRLRGTVSWTLGGFDLSFASNYLNGLSDTRFNPAVDIDTATTFDATAYYRLPVRSGAFQNLELSLSVQNIFDQAPPYSRSTSIAEPPYDTTNFSPLGRFVSLGVSKRW